jgi:hypothetical protein
MVLVPEAVTEPEAAEVRVADLDILLETERHFLNLHQNTLVTKQEK